MMITQRHSYSVVTAPTLSPLAIGEVQQHLYSTGCVCNEEEAYLSSLIELARQRVELDTQRVLCTTTLRLSLDDFPRVDNGYWPSDCSWAYNSRVREGRIIELTRGPVQSVSSITYVAEDGTSTVLSSSKYQVDLYSSRARIAEAYGEVWPDVRLESLNAVIVQFVAGYSAVDEIPQNLRFAMLLLIGHYYQNREAVVAGQMTEVPQGYERLIEPLRLSAGVG